MTLAATGGSLLFVLLGGVWLWFGFLALEWLWRSEEASLAKETAVLLVGALATATVFFLPLRAMRIKSPNAGVGPT